MKNPGQKRIRGKGAGKGRAVDPAAQAEVTAAIDGITLQRDHLIECLHRIQDRYKHLSAVHLTALADLLQLAPTEVYEVATFYHHFDVVREGENAPPDLTVRVCDSVSCSLFGAEPLISELESRYGEGVRIQRVPCVGRCDAAPVAVVGQNAIGHADAAKIAAAVENGERSAEVPDDWVRYQAYCADGGYALASRCVDDPAVAESIIEALDSSGLRGLGGAGFPAGRKWRILKEQPAPRLMAVNIDEGEPGTFKDRYYLERDPHRFLEGVLIAAQVVGIDSCYLYVRDEYPAVIEILNTAIEELRAAHPNPLPELIVRRGAGAYICGEESAMIESIEGKRGLPRLRPPYVAEVGLFGRPTLEHNCETLYWVRDI
ncbi:MAG: NADH-quinone oxidoreductase subunit F, partial [Acidiferrobacter sp.]|nr:NADH-quinone oxidoreductase subunit F [Acidiferrobacter sp.]